MEPVVMKTILGAVASALYGAAYQAPLPWAIVFLQLSAGCVVCMRMIH